MILKYKTTLSENRDQWNYIDGITECSVYFDPNVDRTCIALGAAHNHMVLVLNDEAYLINDNGKTVERISRQLKD